MPVVGARPNFMKIAPLMHALRESGDRFETRLVHTGQHYDDTMSAQFFRDLDIPEPDVNLGVGSGTHGEQVGRTMIAFEQALNEWRPHLVLVVGDVNATLACSVTARKQWIPVAHIEAGLRSFDLGMPEEINRMVTDRLSQLLFTTDEIADSNLIAEGVDSSRIHRVGNIMIDTLERQRAAAQAMEPDAIIAQAATPGSAPRSDRIGDGAFALVTMHRPSNVDDRDILAGLVDFLVDELAARMPVVWPVHPRTRGRLDAFGLAERLDSARAVWTTRPLDYRAMLRMTMGAALMLTDSGGLQEECCVLGTPCVTLRDNTERPLTLIEHGGVSVLTGNDVERVRETIKRLMQDPPGAQRPALWDGRTATRIVDILERIEPGAGQSRTE